MIINDKNFSLFAKSIAAPSEPEEYSQAAVERLMEKLEDRVVRVTGVHTQFKAVNKVQLIDFETEEDRKFYNDAWKRYQAEKARLEGMEGLSKTESRFSILVQFLKFRQAAELCRARYLARAMWESVNRHGKAAVAALNFRPTITKIVTILMDDYNVPRDKISLIWGGSQVKQTKKGNIKKSLMENELLMMQLAAEGIDLESIGFGENVEVKEEVHFDPSLRMGHQNASQRQFEIDQFQRGETDYCFFTFKAGGVGLSLHHTDELCNRYNTRLPNYENWYKELQNYNARHPDKAAAIGKARRKESGYAVEEDIPYIITRPRELFSGPTYSAIELVQGLGRCPRLTSLSDTLQLLVFYRGTIEERVAYITSLKLRCLSKVIKQRESWQDIIIGRDPEVAVKQLEESTANVSDDNEDDSLMGSEIGEDEDEN